MKTPNATPSAQHMLNSDRLSEFQAWADSQSQAANEHNSIKSVHIAELTRQRDALLRKVGMLSEIVREVPSMLTSARLDQAEGKPTSYDYTRHGRALNAVEF